MARVDFDPSRLTGREFHRLLISSLVPRPIAWVSSRSPEGIDNLAPHSMYTSACSEPPILQFTSTGRKDSLNNIEATGEFVINFCPEPLFEQINATATDFPHGVSEFEAVGIATEPSAKVAPPRVADSPIAFECRLFDTKDFGTSTVVFGRVVHLAVAEEVLVEGLPAIELLRPLARLGKIEWMEMGPVRRITRIPHAEWPGHYERPAAGGEPEA
jgi:flavin reductase (DIM6/NTAB) family NADH-FMN oxidoreductase RutF